ALAPGTSQRHILHRPQQFPAAPGGSGGRSTCPGRRPAASPAARRGRDREADRRFSEVLTSTFITEPVPAMAFILPFPRPYPPRLDRLRALSLFSDLTLAEIAILDKLLHQRDFVAGEVVFDEGE